MERRSVSNDRPSRFGRTAPVTAAAIVGVVIAGALAIGANFGILGASDAGELGTLSADELVAPGSPAAAMDTVAPSTTVSTAPAAWPLSQAFAVDAAGTATLLSDGVALRLGGVEPAAGWSWSLEQADPAALVVSFTDGGRTLVLRASLDAGAIVASVEEPAAGVPPAAATTISASDGRDDDHDDDEDEYEVYEEHEGRDDDD